jgi:hypothetical protein
VIGLFVFEWTPYLIVYVWPIFADPKTIPLRLALAGPLFAKTSVVLNPLLYLFVEDFVMPFQSNERSRSA